MLRRLFSSTINKVNCSDCRLFNSKKKSCKINNLNATENRIDDNICGLEGKKYWELDKTYLIKSNTYYKYSTCFGIFTLSSLPFLIFYDFGVIYFTIYSLIVGELFSDISEDYKKRYLDNNDINDNY